MNTNQVAGVHGTRPTRIPLVSECPRCRSERAQWYTAGAIRRLLNGGYPVEAYCTMCNEYWQVGARERAALAGNLRAKR